MKTIRGTMHWLLKLTYTKQLIMTANTRSKTNYFLIINKLTSFKPEKKYALSFHIQLM